MKLLAARVDWMEDWDTWPRLDLTVDALPPQEERLYRRSTVDPRCFYTEDDGCAGFLFGDPHRPGDGFYGSAFELAMVGGETVTLIGPFSGAASDVNQTEFGPVVEAFLRETSTEGVARTWAGHVTLPFARKAAGMAGVELAEFSPSWAPGSTVWIPVGGPVRRCPVCLVRVGISGRDGCPSGHPQDGGGISWTWPEPTP